MTNSKFLVTEIFHFRCPLFSTFPSDHEKISKNHSLQDKASTYCHHVYGSCAQPSRQSLQTRRTTRKDGAEERKETFEKLTFPSFFFLLRFSPQDLVTGVIRVRTKGGLSHNGITVNLSGRVTFIMSSKSVGMIESIYSSLKPITLADYTTQVCKSGKLYPLEEHTEHLSTPKRELKKAIEGRKASFFDFFLLSRTFFLSRFHALNAIFSVPIRNFPNAIDPIISF